MRHQVTSRISMIEPRGIAGFDEPRMQMRAPMFFVGIQREIAPPLVFGQNRLQRMRVILVEPGEAIDLADAGGDDSLPEVLPQLPAPPHHLALQPRLVQGEILRGENDELYEKIGGRIRRLRRLVSGPRGEILDVVAEPAPSTGPTQEELPAQEQQQQAPAICKLLPGPGPRRIVCFGEYKQMLASQLAHPERLRDAHRLPCHVQVYELTAPQKFDAIAAAIFGNAATSGRLQPLTHEVVMHLQLGPLLPAPPRIPRQGQRESGVVLPGERLFCLQLAGDPTAEENPEPPACRNARADLTSRAKNEHSGAVYQAVGISDQPGGSALRFELRIDFSRRVGRQFMATGPLAGVPVRVPQMAGAP